MSLLEDARVQVRVLVIEADDKAELDQVGLLVVEEAAAERVVKNARLKRPSESVLDKPTRWWIHRRENVKRIKKCTKVVVSP